VRFETPAVHFRHLHIVSHPSYDSCKQTKAVPHLQLSLTLSTVTSRGGIKLCACFQVTNFIHLLTLPWLISCSGLCYNNHLQRGGCRDFSFPRFYGAVDGYQSRASTFDTDQRVKADTQDPYEQVVCIGLYIMVTLALSSPCGSLKLVDEVGYWQRCRSRIYRIFTV